MTGRRDSTSAGTPLVVDRSISSNTIRLGRVQPQAPGHRTVFCNDREANHLAKYKVSLDLPGLLTFPRSFLLLLLL